MSGLVKLPESQETMGTLGDLGNSMLRTSLGVLMSKDLSCEIIMTTCCLRSIKYLAFFVDHLPKLYLFIQRKFFIFH